MFICTFRKSETSRFTLIIMKILSIILIILSSVNYCTGYSNDELPTINRLRKALLTDAKPAYQRQARPVKKYSTAINVSISVHIERIDEWDLRTGTLKMDGAMIITWIDQHLQWNPDDYDGLDHIFFSIMEVWTPELTIWSSSDTQYINRFIDYGTPILVNASGHCEWWPIVTLSTHCPAVLTNFPFDVNTCRIRIGPYAHISSEMQLDMKDHIFESGYSDDKTDGFYGPWVANPEYVVINKSATNSDILLSDFPQQKWSGLNLFLTIQRRSSLYTIYIVLPYVTASVIQIVMFILTRPTTFARTFLSALSLFLFFLALLLITIAIGLGSLHSRDAPYAIKCIGVNMFVVALNLILTQLFAIFIPQNAKLPFMDKLSILWTNQYLHMICCKIFTNSIEYDDPSSFNLPPRITVVNDRMRITDDDNLSNDESVDQDKPATSTTNGQLNAPKAIQSPLLIIIDRIQLIVYTLTLIYYHS